jgi:hypothetical protein
MRRKWLQTSAINRFAIFGTEIAHISGITVDREQTRSATISPRMKHEHTTVAIPEHVP